MAEPLSETSRFARVFTAVAVAYAVLVASAVWIAFPTQRQIESDTAWNAIWAVQQHDAKYRNMPLRDIRRRLYRGLTDEQVTARVREFAESEQQRAGGNAGAPNTGAEPLSFGFLGGDAATPRVVVLLEEVEQMHARRMAALASNQRSVIVWGIVAWVVPVVLLFALGPRLLRPRRSLQRF
jgi:hypothetical protein